VSHLRRFVAWLVTPVPDGALTNPDGGPGPYVPDDTEPASVLRRSLREARWPFTVGAVCLLFVAVAVVAL
jgi:hypothetical protein